MEYSTGVFVFSNLFSFLPKLSQTFLYLEAEKATDQKFGSKSGELIMILPNDVGQEE